MKKIIKRALRTWTHTGGLMAISLLFLAAMLGLAVPHDNTLNVMAITNLVMLTILGY